MRVFTSVLLTLTAPAAAAQTATPLVQHFAGSTVILHSGDTLRGSLTLHTDRNAVLVTTDDGRVRTFTAQQVRVFAVKGNLDGYRSRADRLATFRGHSGQTLWGPNVASSPLQLLNRIPLDTTHVREYRSFFWSLPQQPGGRPVPAFFEVLSLGPVSLVRRERLILTYAQRSNPGLPPEFSGANQQATREIGRNPEPSAGDLKDVYYLATEQGVVELPNPRRDVPAYFRARISPGQLRKYARAHHLSFYSPQGLAGVVAYAAGLR
jgi:hypothetical protein